MKLSCLEVFGKTWSFGILFPRMVFSVMFSQKHTDPVRILLTKILLGRSRRPDPNTKGAPGRRAARLRAARLRA